MICFTHSILLQRILKQFLQRCRKARDDLEQLQGSATFEAGSSWQQLGACRALAQHLVAGLDGYSGIGHV